MSNRFIKMFSMDSAEITETDKDEYGLLNVSIKEEPLDVYGKWRVSFAN